MKLLVAATSLLVLSADACMAQVVLNAAPTVRVVSGEDSTERAVLSEAEREEYRVVITVRDGRYFWTSREGAELVHSRFGAFDWFKDPGGGGYVKVLDAERLPEFLRDPGPRFVYMEHLTIWLGTITYWGSSETFDLLGGKGPSTEQ